MFGQARKQHQEYEEVALPHLDALYAMALRMTRNPGDADDLVQDTLLRGFRFFHRFERGTNAKAWLFKILTNLFHDSYRNRSRERDILAEADDGGFLIPESNLGGSPESQVLRRSTADALRHALETLPQDFRAVILLADLEEFSYREIADIVGCPVGTVMSRLHRGRKLLREAIEKSAETETRTTRAVVLPFSKEAVRKEGKPV